MTRFNKAHSIFISKIHSLPGELGLFLKLDGEDKECLTAKTLPYQEIISRFKVITSDFPREIDYDNSSHFQKSLGQLPYPVVDRALASLVESAISHVWKFYQVDNQCMPLVQKIIDAFSEIIDLRPVGNELNQKRLISSFTFFTRCSIDRSLSEANQEKADSVIAQAASRMAKRYNGRYDHLPKDYAEGFTQKYAHIKAIAFIKRQTALFKEK